jgi:hypothetical protein
MKENEVEGGMWCAWERREKCTSFWWESTKEGVQSIEQGTDGGGMRMDVRESDWGGCGVDSSASG